MGAGDGVVDEVVLEGEERLPEPRGVVQDPLGVAGQGPNHIPHTRMAPPQREDSIRRASGSEATPAHQGMDDGGHRCGAVGAGGAESIAGVGGEWTGGRGARGEAVAGVRQEDLQDAVDGLVLLHQPVGRLHPGGRGGGRPDNPRVTSHPVTSPSTSWL